jgi:hypothetical protein
MAIEPTPPEPPTMRMALAPPGAALRMSSRSNSISHAVMVVSGSAAASAIGERARLQADDPLVDQMELAVGARTRDRAGITNLVARLEAFHVRTRLGHLARDVPAENLP